MSINYTNQNPYIGPYLEEQGYAISEDSGVFTGTDILGNTSPAIETAVQNIIDTYDPVPSAKIEKLEELGEEAGKRLSTLYGFMDHPDYAQYLLDVYGLLKANARNNISGNLQLVIDTVAEYSTVSSIINGMTDWQTVRSYDVVNTPAWPV
jgi:hypothetical protein